jgi:hypothetical protein
MQATLDKHQVALLRRLNDADHLSTSDLHDFATLMGDDLKDLPDHWLSETFEAFETLGFLHLSGRTSGAFHGRLSSQGRWFLERLDAEAP